MDPPSPHVPSHPFSMADRRADGVVGENHEQQAEPGSKLVSLDQPQFTDLQTELEQIRQQITGGLDRLREMAERYSSLVCSRDDRGVSSPTAGTGSFNAQAVLRAPDEAPDCCRQENPFLTGEAPSSPSECSDPDFGERFWTAEPSRLPVVDVDPPGPFSPGSVPASAER